MTPKPRLKIMTDIDDHSDMAELVSADLESKTKKTNQPSTTRN